jgi:hypothetical protein
MKLVLDIADAVVMELNNAPPGTFTPAIVAQRRVLPVFDPQELTELRVTMVPKSVTITGATRAMSQYEITIDIGVQQKLPAPGVPDLDAAVAALSDLVQQIAHYLHRRPLTHAPGVSWSSVANEPVYAPEHLAQQRVFTSVLTVTYRALR